MSRAFRRLPHSPNDDFKALTRATALIQLGDIASARLWLERALERGSARAAFMLAETYDPQILRSWRVFGVEGDPEKATALYGRAYAGGSFRQSNGLTLSRVNSVPPRFNGAK